ncbi:unnamed protein product [Rotaria sordida]|uniref:Cyanate lyase C-terminal domain-containing protein n=1 Tax=Rotaria sordida TaxID=392033 RepID=A0A819N8S9_9BILA|nr:unnamed protein product [Rotaria sordida]
MSSFFNSNYFQAILNLIGNRNSTISTLWGMFWQAFYALAGCVVGAVIFGNIGALIGTVIGAWLGFRAVNPYHSLISQLNQLNDHQKQNLTDEVRRTVGSSTVDNLLRYGMNSNGRQLIFDIIQRYLNNQQPQQRNTNPAALFYGQASFPDEKECQKLLDILHVNLSSAQMYELTHPPFKGSILPSLPSTDPLLYRFHEILLQYGVPMKEVIHEKFGDGIMSAVDFTIKVDKDETIKEAPRVNINMSGKFLPYKRW